MIVILLAGVLLGEGKMRSALFTVTTFLVPFCLYGDLVGRQVAKQLAKASFCYSMHDVQLGYLAFFLFAGTMAGLVCLLIGKILLFEMPQKYLGLAAVLISLATGYVIADVTLYGFYERHEFRGPVMQWLTDTAQAFCLWGLLPALAIYFLLLYSSRKKASAQTS